jgi:hypothetical protein
MKLKTLLFILPLIAGTLSAQNTFNVVDGDITVGGNWSSGLPTTAGNVGTIAVDGVINSQNNLNYHITQNAGTITDTHGLANTRFQGGSVWMINSGATLTINSGIETGGNQMTVNTGGIMNVTGTFEIGGQTSGSVFTLAGGTLNASSAVSVQDGSTFNMTGGTFDAGGNNFSFSANKANSFINVSGGTINNVDAFGAPFGGSHGTATFTGGTLNANTLNFRSPADFSLVLGGSNAGALNFSNGWGNITGTTDIQWNSGSLMTMTLTGETDWAETVWNAGAMTHDGQDFTTLGNWSAVSGSLFDYDAGTQTLSLIPEPSVFALSSLGFGVLWLLRRRTR